VENQSEEFVTGNIKFSLYGEPVEMQMNVPAKPVKPTRMLPIFQSMTNEFLDIGINASLAKGETISCTKGCGACCRQPVPISEIEVYQLAELVENMPEPKRSEVKKKFAAASEQLHKINWFDRMDNFVKVSSKERQALALEYINEQIACPFLEDESCSIHQDRPLACREYLVTSPAENCTKPTAETVKPIKNLLKLSDVLRKMSLTENMKTQNFVLLTRSLEWAKTHPNKLVEKTGEQWMSEFFQHIKLDEEERVTGKDLMAKRRKPRHKNKGKR
jgi:Fe-S-cluster containining protein